jgi:hypothetical protein
MPRRYVERGTETAEPARQTVIQGCRYKKRETDVAKESSQASPGKEGKRGDMEAQQEWCGKVSVQPVNPLRNSL